jgi:VIT1/CCC1 family predicted Fe2+/Mn2+ transporter
MHGMAGDANALQAAFASSFSFALGAGMPLLGAVWAPVAWTVQVVAAVALLALVILGGAGARLGGAPMRPSILRVVFWGSLAMLVTSGVGRLFGVHV